MKRYQVFIIAVLMSLCSVIGSASANTIVFMNVPLVQKSDEELQQYLKLCKWEELPTNTKWMPEYGHLAPMNGGALYKSAISFIR